MRHLCKVASAGALRTISRLTRPLRSCPVAAVAPGTIVHDAVVVLLGVQQPAEVAGGRPLRAKALDEVAHLRGADHGVLPEDGAPAAAQRLSWNLAHGPTRAVFNFGRGFADQAQERALRFQCPRSAGPSPSPRPGAFRGQAPASRRPAGAGSASRCCPASKAAPAPVISQPLGARAAKPSSVSSRASAMTIQPTFSPAFLRERLRSASSWPSVSFMAARLQACRRYGRGDARLPAEGRS